MSSLRDQLPLLIVLASVTTALFGYCAISGIMALALRRRIINLPTSRIRSIAMGLCEIEGTVVAGKKTLVDPISYGQCVYWRCIKEYRDGKGNKARWPAQERSVLFYLRDETGIVAVDARKASVDLGPWETISIPPEGFDNRGVLGNIISSISDVTYRVQTIRVGAHIYLLGTAGDNTLVPLYEDERDTMIWRGARKAPFYISTGTENMARSRLLWRGVMFCSGAGIILAGGLYGIRIFFR